MGQLGFGVMIQMLAGNADSVAAFAGAVGKAIEAISVSDNEILFTFADGTKMALSDEGQSCCESRYMSCDDELANFIGATLLDAEVVDGPSVPTEYDDHDTAFLKVLTSNGVLTVVTHVEHNGYYGGFAIRAQVRR